MALSEELLNTAPYIVIEPQLFSGAIQKLPLDDTVTGTLEYCSVCSDWTTVVFWGNSLVRLIIVNVAQLNVFHTISIHFTTSILYSKIIKIAMLTFSRKTRGHNFRKKFQPSDPIHLLCGVRNFPKIGRFSPMSWKNYMLKMVGHAT